MSSQGIITLENSLFSHTFLCNSTFFLLRKNEVDSDNKNHNEVIPLNNADSFLVQDNAIVVLRT